MAIAFSRRPVLERMIAADDTAEEFVNAFALLLEQAGWERIGTVDPGYKFEVTSRQNLQARFRVWADAIDTARFHVQVSDVNELAVSSVVHLLTAPGRAFQIIVGHCQVFMSLPGIANEPDEGVYGHNFAFGVPFVAEGELSTAVIPGECGVSRNDDVTTNIWWLSGSTADPEFGQPATLRSTLTCGGESWRACRNGVEVGGPYQGPLRILPLRHPIPLWGPSLEVTRWSNGDPLLLDPYLAWGSATELPRYRAQLYDALLASYDHPLEATIETEEPTVDGGTVTVEWINYSHTPGDLTNGEPGTYNGSLFLMRGDPPERSNYCY